MSSAAATDVGCRFVIVVREHQEPPLRGTLFWQHQFCLRLVFIVNYCLQICNDGQPNFWWILVGWLTDGVVVTDIRLVQGKPQDGSLFVYRWMFFFWDFHSWCHLFQQFIKYFYVACIKGGQTIFRIQCGMAAYLQ